MGKKLKKGKDRLDKFYHLAKDQGYRARSAFKLIQLAKKFDFLSKARVCLDLCAAPGGWSQVAQRNMPSGSQIIAIDLMPIRPLQGVVCIQSDITSEKCRNLVKKELKGEKADIVLHDGAPNVGANWSKDAFDQNELTLKATKMACEHLKVGGTYVTKVFRSADYNSLLWVFHQLFSKVDATKPTASRNVSAEIFVMCIGFKGGKIDPKFFDTKWVFMEVLDPVDKVDPDNKKGGPKSLSDILKGQPKKHRGGYDLGDDLKIVPAEDFIAARNPAEMIVTHHRINLGAPGSEEIAQHAFTTEEIRELCDDLKVLGKKDLAILLKWRMKLVREREKKEREVKKAEAEARKAAAEKAAGRSAPANASEAIKHNVDEAIAGLLEEDAKKSLAAAKDGSASESDNEDLERELAEQVELRRKEEKRQLKKTMARQKKQEFRRKMSLGASKYITGEQPELFKITDRNVEALEDEANYAIPEDIIDKDSDEGEQLMQDFGSDSDSEMDRFAKLEVDLAVGYELKKMHSEANFRTSMQRKRKRAKETRRQKTLAAWSGELAAFNEALDEKVAAEHALLDKQEAEEDDELEDNDSEVDLQELRDYQKSLETAPKSGVDGEALSALLDGPPQDPPQAASESEEGSEDGDKPPRSRRDASKGTIVPVDEDDEDAIRATHRADRWFSQDIFKNIGADSEAIMPWKEGGAMMDQDEEDEQSNEDPDGIKEAEESMLPKMPLTDRQRRKLKRKKDQDRLEKFGKRPKTEEKDDTPLEVTPLEAPKRFVPLGAVEPGRPQKPKDPQELAETLALGSLLVSSKKSRMELIDAAYNRWAFDGEDGLPDWFTEEECKYNKPELPISKELMDQFRAKLREINARPIRKVAEARARKKRRLKMRLDKLRATAMSLSDNPEMSSGAKAKMMKSEMRKMMKADQRKVTTVAVKKGGGGKQMGKQKGRGVPKGAKVKVVDRRLKSDKRGEKKAFARNKKYHKNQIRKQAEKKGKKGKRGGINSKLAKKKTTTKGKAKRDAA
mmetsp:Transcript_21317/g.47093  ORF Transcript_21317/g.47093 Transcript_21317/m.47093 type:complete len:1018 (-) Transcript_21317:92-3145(-)|eukprot:CAMPEP_0170610618 /NCGR_PEP_ID=MMETSP0224-20130122/22756_1 /TAXON_ID=285029 /ORGANISM="Togula jolla, Strain CCCM 725" /LENGTH=1017 /DNA_ID=CAMNT_0010936007 /DNA_START=32 /DNA_END=3085 /DNA_ORIENTATION=+